MRGIGLLILSILCKLLRIRVGSTWRAAAVGGLVGGSAGGAAAAVGGLAGRGIWAQKSPEVGFLGVIGCAAAIETRRI